MNGNKNPNRSKFDSAFESAKNFANNTRESTCEYDPSDIQKNKTMAGLAYILFFLPLIACPDSRYARFHANQGLLLLLLWGVGNMILNIQLISWLIGWLLNPIFNLLMFAGFLMGLLNGFNGRAKELPLIGSYRLIK